MLSPVLCHQSAWVGSFVLVHVVFAVVARCLLPLNDLFVAAARQQSLLVPLLLLLLFLRLLRLLPWMVLVVVMVLLMHVWRVGTLR